MEQHGRQVPHGVSQQEQGRQFPQEHRLSSLSGSQDDNRFVGQHGFLRLPSLEGRIPRMTAWADSGKTRKGPGCFDHTVENVVNGVVQAVDQVIIKLDDNISLTFVQIPECREGFLMGSRGYFTREEPIHGVVIEEDFWMAQAPVTQAQFAAWTSSEGIKHKNHFQGKPDHPAENMTWRQASEYCDWLTKKFDDQFPSEHRFATLPTEAHWEYACRAGTDTEYYSGDGEAALHQSGWFDDTSSSTHPVGKLRPNDFGLHDLHGNVWEWCLDRWDEEAYRRRWDGITVEETFRLNEEFGDQGGDPYRLVRGGSWIGSADGCRAAFRSGGRAGISLWDVGFRVCLVRSPIISSQSDRPASREQ